MEKVTYKVESITLAELQLPDPSAIGFSESDEVTWEYAYGFQITPFPDNQVRIPIDFTYFLYLKNDPERKPLALVTTSSSFSVTRELSAEGKLFILYHVLTISLWHLQGIYAAKAEGNPVVGLLPPEIDFTDNEEEIKKGIDEDWT